MSAAPLDLESLRQELAVARGSATGLESPTPIVKTRGGPSTGVGKKAGEPVNPTTSARLARVEVRKEEFIRYLVAGYSMKEIGAVLGVHPTTFSFYIRQDPTILDRIREKSKEVGLQVEEEIFGKRREFNERLQAAADDALEEMERLLVESPSENIRLKAAQDLLDRDGRAPRTARTEGRTTVVNLDAEMLKVALQAAREDEMRGRG